MRKVEALKKESMEEEVLFLKVYEERDRGGMVKCYTCGKEGNKSWEFPDRKGEGGETHIVEA
jgi:hypothetical protein